MRRRFFFSFISGALIVGGALTAVVAQTTNSLVADKFIISARAGGINIAQGPISVARPDGTGGPIMKGDRLNVGDRVSTGHAARAEVLLNPGSYLRLAEESEFEFVSTGLDDLEIKLHSGTAIFEVFATDKFRVSVVTSSGTVFLVDSGVYRFDLNRNGTAKLSVIEGKAELGDARSAEIKKGRTAFIDGSGVIAKFDQGRRDEFDEWSKSRGKELAKVTSSLREKDLRTSLLNSFNGRGWGMYASFGLWVYNPLFDGYSFLPFGYRWSSPYGYGFGSGFNWGWFPWRHYPKPETIAGGNGTPPAPPKVSQRVRRTETEEPPFAEVEKRRERRVPMIDDSGSWPSPTRSSGRDSSPVYLPPVAAPPAARGGRIKPIE